MARTIICGGFAMLSRFLAGAVCAVGILVSSCASADPGYYPWSNFMSSFSAVPREGVNFPSNHEPGTVIVRAGERRLYLILGKGQALRYGIGVGRGGVFCVRGSTVNATRGMAGTTPTPGMIR